MSRDGALVKRVRRDQDGAPEPWIKQWFDTNTDNIGHDPKASENKPADKKP